MSDNKEEIICEVLEAYMKEGDRGIYLKLINKKIELPFIVFVPSENWGKVPEGKNEIEELQIIVDLFNGFNILENGVREINTNFIPKKIKITQE